MAAKIPSKLINRINQLAHKQKSVGLTADELAEQQSLRETYLALFRQTFRSNVEMMRVFDKNGKEVTSRKVREIQKQRGLRDD
ncbi:DUF896 domain-containing protein [Liquorilactobacillus sicerae]|uniref:DUF896 domain-containing protein n=1 Tax=Liquorilactobacillus sicerae TaxID=1416943 RepID=UPI00247FA447|nr:DUF896 domain-containing protein [Liquorilactobacillus sicerae]